MHRALAPLTFAALLASTLPARADIAPTCGDFDTLVNCASADIGTTCPTGGTCMSIPCDGKSVLKCYPCPTKVDDPAMVCTGGQDFGKTCGDGGKCMRIANWCPNSGYSVCAKETTAGTMDASPSPQDSGVAEDDAATSKDAGTTTTPAASSSSGCSLGAAGSQAALAGLMITVGAAALLFDRRRSRRP